MPFERFLCNFLKKLTVQRAKLRASTFKNSSHTGLAILRDYSFSLKNQQCYRLKFTWSFPLKISIFLDSGQNFALEFPWPIGTTQRTGNCLSVSWILAINLRKNMGEIVFLLSSHTGLAILRDYSFSLKNQQCYRLKFTWSFPLKISIFLDSGQNFALEFPWPIGTTQRTGNCLSVSWILAINLRKNMGEIVFLLSTQHQLLVWFHGRNVQEI